jgi:hypothetical protein
MRPCLFATISLCGAVAACTSSATSAGNDGGLDAGGNPGGDGGQTGDAGPDGGPGSNDGGPDGGATVVVTFAVPAGGGSVQVTGSQVYTLTFPADVAGQTFTVEILPSTSFGFAPGRFLDFLKLGPNGTQFTTPVTVRPIDPTTLAPVAFLYPEPVTPAGAEAVFAQGGAYPLGHFSAFGMPGPGPVLCSSYHSNSGAQDSCVPFAYTATNGYQAGDPVASPGLWEVGMQCEMDDSCMEIDCQGCVDTSAKDAILAGGWLGSGSPPFGYCDVGYVICPAYPPPPGCSHGALASLTPNGCYFKAICNSTPVSLSCNNGTCTCGGSSSKTFPQGAMCTNVIAGMSAMFAQCQ